MTLRLLQLFKRIGTVLQTLSLYGASGIVGFGWTLSRLLHFRCGPYAPLWFCAAVFIYNLDRLKADPADPINMPRRSRVAARLRKVSTAVAALAATALVLLPILQGNRLMILLTIGGGLVCMNYSLAPLGFRLKDIPLLKTFFAPTLVTAAFLVPPFLEQDRATHIAMYALATVWTWCVLMFNMILCDLRDIQGDTQMGIKSLPVALGSRGTMFSLGILIMLVAFFSVLAARHLPSANARTWRAICAGTIAYLSGLLVAVRRLKSNPEWFYEWWVEGILFVPAVVYFSGSMAR